MSRNRCSQQCDCGYQLELRNATTRPMWFHEYMRVIGWKDCPYEDEYQDLIVAQIQCPECGRLYAAWLRYKYGCHPFDTSYWYSFNDEPGEKDRLLIPVEAKRE